MGAAKEIKKDATLNVRVTGEFEEMIDAIQSEMDLNKPFGASKVTRTEVIVKLLSDGITKYVKEHGDPRKKKKI